MKKCPYCSATIEENARFCIYCMRELEGKNKTGKIKTLFNKKVVLVSFLVVIIAALVTVFILLKPKTEPNLKGKISGTNSGNTTFEDTQDGKYEPQNPTGEGSYVGSSEGSSGPGGSGGNNGSNNGGNSGGEQSGENDSGSSVPSGVQGGGDNEPTVIQAEYTYRAAENTDVFVTGADLINKITITGIKKQSSNGIYKIPETIDGKKVVAIGRLAFWSEDMPNNNMKKIVIPASVKSINEVAFAGCTSLTDVYYCGDSIHTDARAFYKNSYNIVSSNIKLHCGYNCDDMNFRYYRNTASNYGVTYCQWDGVIDF